MSNNEYREIEESRGGLEGPQPLQAESAAATCALRGALREEKAFYVDQMEDPFDRRGCAAAPFFRLPDHPTAASATNPSSVTIVETDSAEDRYALCLSSLEKTGST